MNDIEKASELLAQAMRHHQQGALDAAESGYRAWLSVQGEDHRVLHLLGGLCYQRGDAAQAVHWFERAIALDDTQADYFLNLGLARKQLGDGAGAVEACRRATGLEPDSAAVWLGLSNAQRQTGAFAEALAAAERALTAAPDSIEARVARGAALRALGRPDEAVAEYREVLKRRPDHIDAQHNLGNALVELGDQEQAAACFRHVLASEPTDRAALERLVALAEAVPRSDLETLFQRLAESHGDARLFALWGRWLQQQGHLEQAEARYRQALALDADDADCLNDLGTLYTHRGDHASAAEYYRRALDSGGADAARLFNLANARMKLGDNESAIQGFRAALTLKPDFSQASFNLGMLFYGLERNQDAARVFDEWLAREPDHPVARHLARAARGERLERCADDYVRSEFDHFASDYESVLAGLNYRGPELIGAALTRILPAGSKMRDVLDAGCGTGLCGPLLRPWAQRLTGVDLSAGMLSQARATGLYDALHEAELSAWLADRPAAFDLIISADTLNYFGRLDTVLAALRTALRPAGRLIFTLERAPHDFNDDYHLNPNGRFMHGEGYVVAVLDAVGLHRLHSGQAVIREELGRPVEAHVIVAGRE